MGLLSDIQKKYGCADPKKWVNDLAATLTAEEKESRKKVTVELSPSKTIDKDKHNLRYGGDLMLLGIYNKLEMNTNYRNVKKIVKTPSSTFMYYKLLKIKTLIANTVTLKSDKDLKLHILTRKRAVFRR